MAPLGTTLDLADRTVIDREGRKCAQLVVLVRGVAAVTAKGTLEEILRRGDVWGDAGTSCAVARRTLVAVGTVRIHAYSKRELKALQHLLPELGQQLLRSGTATARLVSASDDPGRDRDWTRFGADHVFIGSATDRRMYAGAVMAVTKAWLRGGRGL